MIGRAYLWGLAADGQAGVENVLDILRERDRLDAPRARPRLGPRAHARRCTGAGRLRPGARRRRLRLTHAGVSAAVEDLCWPEVAGRGGDLMLLVPVGATEQHGPHLPLSTDTEIATAIAQALAAMRPAAVVAPALAYGASGEHAGFAGTLSIGSAAVELVLVELVRSASASFGRVVLVSAHGGNAEAVARAVRRLRAERLEVLAFSPRLHADAHAGRSETSIMLALRPDAVRAERAEAGNTSPVAELWPVLRRMASPPSARTACWAIRPGRRRRRAPR